MRTLAGIYRLASHAPRRALFPVLVAALAAVAVSAPAESASENQPGPTRLFPSHETYTAGTIKPDHRTQAQLDADVADYYDRWKADHVIAFGPDADGAPIYRVGWNPGQEAETISEAQGYGMTIAVQMAGHDPAARELFDGLYRWVRLHPSAGDSRLTQWHAPVDVWHQAYAAFDGDADIAYALLLADRQWGSGTGPIRYRAEADGILAGMADTLLGPDSGLPLFGEALRADGELTPAEQRTLRVSDVMPASFRAFARATGDQRWRVALNRGERAVSSLQSGFAPGTGLVPDFAVPADPAHPARGDLRPASPFSVEGQATDGDYAWNSARVPWRFGFDHLTADDARSRRIAGRISRWAEAAAGGDPRHLMAGYALDGTPLASYSAAAFVAPLGVAAMTQPAQQEWLNAVYDTVRTSHNDYFGDTVTLLCLLVMSGNHQAA